jgi:hypothetical protein
MFNGRFAVAHPAVDQSSLGMTETGAGLGLGKPLIPALVYIATDQLPDPIQVIPVCAEGRMLTYF